MVSFETAKKLKEEGFPQDIKCVYGEYEYSDKKEPLYCTFIHGVPEMLIPFYDVYAAPSIGDLVGEDVWLFKTGNIWFAFNNLKHSDNPMENQIAQDKDIDELGAKVWLYKKQQSNPTQD